MMVRALVGARLSFQRRNLRKFSSRPQTHSWSFEGMHRRALLHMRDLIRLGRGEYPAWPTSLVEFRQERMPPHPS